MLKEIILYSVIILSPMNIYTFSYSTELNNYKKLYNAAKDNTFQGISSCSIKSI